MKHIFYIAPYVACGAGRYIDKQSGRGLYLRYPITSCINFAFYKRSICTEISPQLQGQCSCFIILKHMKLSISLLHLKASSLKLRITSIAKTLEVNNISWKQILCIIKLALFDSPIRIIICN